MISTSDTHDTSKVETKSKLTEFDHKHHLSSLLKFIKTKLLNNEPRKKPFSQNLKKWTYVSNPVKDISETHVP
jgi:hypothetical protein